MPPPPLPLRRFLGWWIAGAALALIGIAAAMVYVALAGMAV
jgi:hypothetical protein